MLSISTQHMDAFGADALQQLLARMDQWLVGDVPAWAQIEAGARKAHLNEIAKHAEPCGFDDENDLAVFAWICVTLGSDWAAKITAPNVWGVLTDPQWRPTPKLLFLEETYLTPETR